MFKLLRYFSIISLILIVVAAVVLGALYRTIAVNNLLVLGERNNVALTYALSGILQKHFEPLLQPEATGADSPLRQS